jgi:hypothetical protein
MTEQLAEYTVSIARDRTEYAYVLIQATDSNAAEDQVDKLLEKDQLDDLVFHPGGDIEGTLVVDSSPRSADDTIDCVIENGKPKYLTIATADTALGLAETIARMTLVGECPDCGKSAEVTNAECDDHRAFEMTDEDNQETLISIILKARSIVEQPTPTQSTLDHVHPIFADILKQHFPWLGTDDDASSGADVIGELGELYEQSRVGDSKLTPLAVVTNACTWTDGESVSQGSHQFENGKCSTCGARQQ